MKLRFSVDQAEAFRRGIDVPKSIVTIEVDPAKLPEEARNLIADRLDGIDVRPIVAKQELSYRNKDSSIGVIGVPYWNGNTSREKDRGSLIKASLATYDALMEAVRKNEENVEATERKGGLLAMDEAMKVTGLSEEDLRAASKEVPEKA